MNFTLVRSPRALIDKHQIGYGWASVDFSAYSDQHDLLKNGFKDKSIGRKKNQIKRYFNLKKGDVVVVPLAGTVAFAIVEGAKSHCIEKGIKHGENRISANYLTDIDGKIIYYRRKDLTTSLEARLKIRTSIASLNNFQDELTKIVSGLLKHEIYTVSKEIADKRESEVNHFKSTLLARLRSNKKIWIDAGGQGLEEIVQEIFQGHGYDAYIPAKSSGEGIADIDVKAINVNILTGDLEATFIQVKHHRGSTPMHGIEQLIAYSEEQESYAYFRKVLITSAVVTDAVLGKAEANNIEVIDGEALVGWIYDNIDKLSNQTLKKLGVVFEPSLVD